MRVARLRKQNGFTIVELLIVIVIIAILAAISILAYNGIQQRSNNTQTISSVSAYTRAVKSYYVENQKYPGTVTIPSNISCLGPQGTICGNITDSSGTCGYGQAAYESVISNDIATIASSLPAPSTQTVTCGSKQFRGAFYVNYNTQSRISMFLKGVSTCPAISGASSVVGAAFGDGFLCSVIIQ